MPKHHNGNICMYIYIYAYTTCEQRIEREEGIYATVDSMWKTSRSGFNVGFLQKRQNTKGVRVCRSNVQKTL